MTDKFTATYEANWPWTAFRTAFQLRNNSTVHLKK